MLAGMRRQGTLAFGYAIAKVGVHALQRRAYHSNVLDHFSNPRNVGSFDKASVPNVYSSTRGNASCGDVLKISLKIDPNTFIIEDARFKAFGCGSAIASSSYMTTLVKGAHIDEAKSVSNRQVAAHLRLPPVKIHCSLLVEETVRAAIQSFKDRA